TGACRRILAEVDVALVRGNAAEVAVLAGDDGEVKGVESVGDYDVPAVAAKLARSAGCAVAVTGAVDHVTDGTRALVVRNGHPLLAAITGSGCMATCMAAAFAAVRPGDVVAAAAHGLAVFGIAGERAATGAAGPGSFHVGLYDALAEIDSSTVVAQARIEAVT
ncbi:MAG TPA: hydroxyethylthiazole kinase, partial [Desulfobacterales bacterium]|nr:hydroxyethylthiazole kinase [Desulfobacterales bacterium]